MAIKALEQEPTTKNNLGVDCISRIETIDYLCKHCPDDGECFGDCDDIKHFREMPSVTPQEPKTGHWIYKTMEGQFCSICNEQSVWKFNYCPNCGCRMVEPQESEK